MRIIEGTWAGRELVSPARRVRATAEAVRGGILDALRDRIDGARVLDVFAGSGALGLEALSRGAASADFVENGAAALHALKANVAQFGLAKSREQPVRVFKRDAIPFVEALEAGAYDLALVDPPYGSAKLDRVIAAWRKTKFAGVLVTEHSRDYAVPRGGQRIAFGDTAVTIYGLPPAADAVEHQPISAPKAGKAPWAKAPKRAQATSPKAASGKTGAGATKKAAPASAPKPKRRPPKKSRL